MKVQQRLGQEIRKRRRFLQLRQSDLADIAEVSLRSLIDIERGNGNPTLEQLDKITEVLGFEITLIVRSKN